MNHRDASGAILSAAFLMLVVWLSACVAESEQSAAETEDLMRETIERLSGEASRDFMTYDFGRARDNNAVSVVVPEPQAFELVWRVREQLPDGYVAFIGTSRWLGDEDNGEKVEVVVAPGQDQYDILRVARTDAVNFGMMTEDLISWFEAREDQISVDIFQASTDTIFAGVLNGPTDMDSFVKDLYDFCPDIVDQGSGNKDDLREMLGEHRVLYLWWD